MYFESEIVFRNKHLDCYNMDMYVYLSWAKSISLSLSCHKNLKYSLNVYGKLFIVDAL